MNISLNVPGFTGISCGELIAFEMPSYEPVGRDNPYDNDPYLSGRYLIKSIRHKINVLEDYHNMSIECIKDAVKSPYPSEDNDTLSTRGKKDRTTVLQYTLDDTLLRETSDEI
jgi:hypothetical protein